MNMKDCPLVRLGRYDAQEKDFCLWWSGSGIRLDIACTYLTVEAESFATDHAPWIGVLADGAPIARFPLLKGRHTYPILAGMDPAFSHEITIQRDTQPTPDEEMPVLLHAIDTDGTPKMPKERKRLIEFIGDSLTVGEGCTGAHEAEEWRMSWMCNMAAFPTLVSEGLNADKRVIAVSGWGAWKSWDAIPENRLGRIYEQLCALIPAGNVPYDFRERSADAVVINLGTNDASALGQEADPIAAGRELTQKAAELIKLVRSHQPGALILWAYGLCGVKIPTLLQDAVAQCRAAGDENVYFLQLTDCDGDVGSRQHPSRAAHRKAAEEIMDFLNTHQ